MLNFYTRRFSTQRTPERQMNFLEKTHDRKAFKALKWAFPYTIPIFAGFWFLGIAYGIYANASGFSFVYPLIMSMAIYGGSLEFITVSMLLSPFAPVQTLIMAIMIQARHLFYGISMLDKFKGLGWKKYYLIYGMCDETFSINYSAEIPEDVGQRLVLFLCDPPQSDILGEWCNYRRSYG